MDNKRTRRRGEMMTGGTDAPILNAILDNPAAERARKDEATAAAIERGTEPALAARLYGGRVD